MPPWKAGATLTADQSAWPILWADEVDGAGGRATHVDVSNSVLEVGFGPGRARRLRSWGHDDAGVHWLATRGGTLLHTDTNYARYTHHLVIRNDGWRIRGLRDALSIRLLPGVVYCLDTWSPHQVVPDDRFPGRPTYKVQVAVDRDFPLEQAEATRLLLPWLARRPADTIDQLRPGVAPRSPVRGVNA